MSENPGTGRSRRGTDSKIEGRFEKTKRESWTEDETDGILPHKVTTQFFFESAKTILTSNQSPDLPFSTSINPYRGCEHGCIYCYARPNHAYVDLSPGLDFESKIFVKKNIKNLLVEDLKKLKAPIRAISLGAATDPYQPGERIHQNTRQVLETLLKFKHPVGIVTKSSLIQRDIDILAEMAKLDLVKVFVSITTLNNELWSKLEPRTPAPAKRIETLEKLSQSKIPVGVMFAPAIPFLNDFEMESILSKAKESGAASAGMVLLRLPHEVAPLFVDWLDTHYPLKKDKILKVISEARGGKLYDSAFGKRMIGSGNYSDLLQNRFRAAIQRLGLNNRHPLRTDLFKVPEEYQIRKYSKEEILPGLFD
ncbi:radical SAM protein [Leptospira perolatii]|uniref:Radical SAM protein n=1 Tax=Leptospira perolatii TaxID=2023191 RepID=A0A2M9ZSC8_9LEPT|nr:PA0069 family radical SAM protein [Leptospira perolatii]PJZ71462.1 radical SAM protein [Leptospira perolatii]PJZ74997.1 radical SAM protein [Leptospira perolatii]